jgi:NAD(P)H-hydrate epimerase
MAIMLTRAQVREVDRVAIEEYGVSGLVLMENAGRNAVEAVDGFLHRADRRLSGILIVCGSGNNGGDGFVMARHLSNRGETVRVNLLSDLVKLSPDAAANYQICKAMNIPIAICNDAGAASRLEIRERDLIVDAILGTGFLGDVREPAASVIRRINQSTNAGVVAIDVPSGLDCDTGTPAADCVRADMTVTFVASKVGFESPAAKAVLGRVVVADIGAPREIIDRVMS